VDFKYLIVRKEDGIGWLKLNRPPMNTLSTEVVLEIERAMDWFAHEDDVMVIVIYAEGKAFVAGADISEMSEFTPMQAREFARNGHRALGKIAGMDKPVIAAVNGYALGGGCEIAIACDIRVLADTVKIGQPEVNLGLIPGFGGTQRLARLVGPGIAKELIYTGKRIEAPEALRIGLIQQIYPKDKLMEETLKMAGEIAGYNPVVVQAAKRACNVAMSYPLEIGLSYETISSAFTMNDTQHGTRPFAIK